MHCGKYGCESSMFADDICVFSPSSSGLQCLLNICNDYAAEHEITFNCNKTIAVLFCPKSKNILHGAPFVKKLHRTDLAQKLLSLRIYSYLCTEIAISAQI